MKNVNLLNFVNNIGPLASKKLPIKLSYAINKNYRASVDALKIYEEERLKLIEEYEGDELNEKIIELLEVETETPIYKVSLEVIEKVDEANYDRLTLQELDLLEFMIEE